MTSNQVRNLPAGAVLKRKIFQDFEPRFAIVLQSSDKDSQPGVGITVAWEQESHPLYNTFDFELDNEFPNDREGWRDPIRWRRERVPVYDEEHKTWWRNWKRIA